MAGGVVSSGIRSVLAAAAAACGLWAGAAAWAAEPVGTPLPVQPWRPEGVSSAAPPAPVGRAALPVSKACRGCDLRGADLRGLLLSGMDLRDADLRGADLRGSNLEGADLSGSNLQGARLAGAWLSNADLSDADLRRADLRDAVMIRALSPGVNLEGAVLVGADLHGSDLVIGGPDSEVPPLPELPTVDQKPRR